MDERLVYIVYDTDTKQDMSYHLSIEGAKLGAFELAGDGCLEPFIQEGPKYWSFGETDLVITGQPLED